MQSSVVTVMESGSGMTGGRALVDEVIENLIHWTEKSFGESNLIAAREEFTAKVGKVFSDDPHFTSYMAYFLDYLIFERPAPMNIIDSLRVHFRQCAAQELVPFYVASRGKPWPSDSTKAPLIGQLQGFKHGVYEVILVGKDNAVFKDLVTGDKVTVQPRVGESFVGLARKDYLQCHLYNWGGVFHLSEGILGHPASVRRTIRKRIKVHKKERRKTDLDFLLGLVFAKLKHLRLKTTQAAKIYIEC